MRSRLLATTLRWFGTACRLLVGLPAVAGRSRVARLGQQAVDLGLRVAVMTPKHAYRRQAPLPAPARRRPRVHPQPQVDPLVRSGWPSPSGICLRRRAGGAWTSVPGQQRHGDSAHSSGVVWLGGRGPEAWLEGAAVHTTP